MEVRAMKEKRISGWKSMLTAFLTMAALLLGSGFASSQENYTGLWASPVSPDVYGLFTHKGTILLAVVFTIDRDSTPMWCALDGNSCALESLGSALNANAQLVFTSPTIAEVTPP
jgi:hypothetical protein